MQLLDLLSIILDGKTPKDKRDKAENRLEQIGKLLLTSRTGMNTKQTFQAYI